MQVHATDSRCGTSLVMPTFTRIPPYTNWGVWESLHHHHNRHHTFNGLRGTGTRETWPLLFFFVLRIAMVHCCVYVPPRRGRSSRSTRTPVSGVGGGPFVYNIKAAGDLRGLGRPLLRGGRLPSHPASGPCTGLPDCRQIARLDRWRKLGEVR